jgi:hypothetical protein
MQQMMISQSVERLSIANDFLLNSYSNLASPQKNFCPLVNKIVQYLCLVSMAKGLRLALFFCRRAV